MQNVPVTKCFQSSAKVVLKVDLEDIGVTQLKAYKIGINILKLTDINQIILWVTP